MHEQVSNSGDGIIAEIHRRQPRSGRAIFLLDQTGFSHVELELVARIFQDLRDAEIILTFAADALVNHLSMTPALIKSVAPLEMTEAQIHELIEYRDRDGGRALIQRVLRPHIRDVAGSTYDTPFFIRPRQSRRALWFLHLSSHPTARDVMIQRHWEVHNTFEHYGPGDFGMLGWDALQPGAFRLFHFEDLEAGQMREQLLDPMARELFGLASKSPITVDEMRCRLANQTAARFTDLDEVVLQLRQEREIEIRDSGGKVRSRTLTRLRPDDRIAIPETLLLPMPGMSRLR